MNYVLLCCAILVIVLIFSIYSLYKISNQAKTIIEDNKQYMNAIDRITTLASFDETIKSTGMPVIEIMIGNGRAFMLIDTGASDNFFHEPYIEKYKDMDHIMAYSDAGGITGFTGAYERSMSAKMAFSINGKEFIEKFSGVDITAVHEAIGSKDMPIMGVIGNSFLSKHKWIIDYSKNIVKK